MRVGRALIISLLCSISVFCLKIFLKCQKYEGVMPFSLIQEISCQIWVKQQYFFTHLWHKITKTGLNKSQKQMAWSPLEKWLYIGTETLLVRDQTVITGLTLKIFPVLLVPFEQYCWVWLQRGNFIKVL